jgi:hypothetical protein
MKCEWCEKKATKNTAVHSFCDKHYELYLKDCKFKSKLKLTI